MLALVTLDKKMNIAPNTNRPSYTFSEVNENRKTNNNKNNGNFHRLVLKTVLHFNDLLISTYFSIYEL